MSVIDDYLQTAPAPERAELERVRKIVLQTAPEAEEYISYGIPAFKYKGKYLIGFAVFKDHLSLFPTPGPIAALKDKLGGFKLSKGTIQFTLDNALPEPLIQELVEHQMVTILQK